MTIKYYEYRAGAVAGMTVDLSLYPLDTLKTRLQAKEGFRQSGGFRGIYRGMPSVLLGSAPNGELLASAIFFCVYDQLKQWFGTASNSRQAAWHHMLAASTAEMAACLIRVPVEVVKQRAQTQNNPVPHQQQQQHHHHHRTRSLSSLSVAIKLWQRDGLREFYRGFGTTIMREIPFTCIQFPLYEYLKQLWAHQRDQTSLTPWRAALCGVVAGGCAAALTTPLDVLKTRKMLSDEQCSSISLLRRMVREEGPQVLLKGVVPRVLWISIGGAIFLGVYEKVIKELS
ncbi:mitochondrial carrier domain-containing protein [Syncephalis plumigaleata]|nr:mitochondrial carrier domain-containing protein [Syncephalis plumigaleata]